VTATKSTDRDLVSIRKGPAFMRRKRNESVLASTLTKPNRNEKQVFVAYPYSLYDTKDYRHAFTDLQKAFNISFLFADEKITTLHILQKIARQIRSSRCGIYDISGWNANVSLELGLAYGMNERAYVIANPSKHVAGEVPSDLRGLDRLQYGSFNELRETIERIITEEFPIQPKHDVENELAALRQQAEQVIARSEGLLINDIAKLLGVSVDIAKVVVYPLVDSSLHTAGTKKGTRYFARKASRPKKPVKNAGRKPRRR